MKNVKGRMRGHDGQSIMGKGEGQASLWTRTLGEGEP